MGENALDATSLLALAPTTTDAKDGTHTVPDFVNTQAIYARALTQVRAPLPPAPS